MQNPPDDNKDNEPEPIDDVHGPSQRDIDRSWDGYESDQGREVYMVAVLFGKP